MSALLLAFAMCAAQVQPVVLAAAGSAGSSSNLALNKSVTYSGVEGDKVNGEWKYPQFVGESAVDGKSDTRWSAAKTDEQWLTVDLGAVYELGEITIDFPCRVTGVRGSRIRGRAGVYLCGESDRWEPGRYCDKEFSMWTGLLRGMCSTSSTACGCIPETGSIMEAVSSN